ncbi:hypothetical protein Tco_1294914 [Tanacetum coccineum]
MHSSEPKNVHRISNPPHPKPDVQLPTTKTKDKLCWSGGMPPYPGVSYALMNDVIDVSELTTSKYVVSRVSHRHPSSCLPQRSTSVASERIPSFFLGFSLDHSSKVQSFNFQITQEYDHLQAVFPAKIQPHCLVRGSFLILNFGFHISNRIRAQRPLMNGLARPLRYDHLQAAFLQRSISVGLGGSPPCLESLPSRLTISLSRALDFRVMVLPRGSLTKISSSVKKNP